MLVSVARSSVLSCAIAGPAELEDLADACACLSPGIGEQMQHDVLRRDSATEACPSNSMRIDLRYHDPYRTRDHAFAISVVPTPKARQPRAPAMRGMGVGSDDRAGRQGVAAPPSGHERCPGALSVRQIAMVREP